MRLNFIYTFGSLFLSVPANLRLARWRGLELVPRKGPAERRPSTLLAERPVGPPRCNNTLAIAPNVVGNRLIQSVGPSSGETDG